MIVSDHARMLAVAPGGWDRCTCRWCNNSAMALTKSARIIERRLVAAEIAEAIDAAVDVAEAFIPLAYDSVVEAEVAAYWEEREAEDLEELLFSTMPECFCRRCFLHNDPGGCERFEDGTWL